MKRKILIVLFLVCIHTNAIGQTYEEFQNVLNRKQNITTPTLVNSFFIKQEKEIITFLKHRQPLSQDILDIISNLKGKELIRALEIQRLNDQLNSKLDLMQTAILPIKYTNNLNVLINAEIPVYAEWLSLSDNKTILNILLAKIENNYLYDISLEVKKGYDKAIDISSELIKIFEIHIAKITNQ